jgi:membrane protein implicated in regulation of membrane protease activity
MGSYAGAEILVGKPAHVSVAIPGGSRAGEVTVRIRGGSEYYIAYADQQIDAGVEVVVVADHGARSVSVAPLYS